MLIKTAKTKKLSLMTYSVKVYLYSCLERVHFKNDYLKQ